LGETAAGIAHHSRLQKSANALQRPSWDLISASLNNTMPCPPKGWAKRKCSSLCSYPTSVPTRSSLRFHLSDRCARCVKYRFNDSNGHREPPHTPSAFSLQPFAFLIIPFAFPKTPR
jgi:hypothetical protein